MENRELNIIEKIKQLEKENKELHKDIIKDCLKIDKLKYYQYIYRLLEFENQFLKEYKENLIS